MPREPLFASPRDPFAGKRGGALAMLSIVGVALLAYANSFSGAFVFDDLPAVRDNPTLRQPVDLRAVFSGPAQTTVAGRPVLNASFALTAALGGGAPWGHHAGNVAIHIAAALTLFGLMRRTLGRKRSGLNATAIAAAAALLWVAHPVQTEAVTYIVQRAESLMALFYLLTLYCFARSTDSPHSAAWSATAVLACALGMGTKEVMASAPLITLLYDRTFVAGSLREAWRMHRSRHLALAATWILLAALVLGGGGNRGGSIGPGTGVGWWEHAATQFGAVTHYLRLAWWPHPLVFEYEPVWVRGVAEIFLPAIIVLLLLVATGGALWRNRAAGVLGAAGFAILAPTSLLPAPTQLIVEHRLYLPLAAALAGAAVLAGVGLGRRALAPLGLLVIALVILTARRNQDYRNELALWNDTVAKRPLNSLAHGSLANALSRTGRLDEAQAHAEEAVRLEPQRAFLHYNLAVVLGKRGHLEAAALEYAEALRRQPDYAEAHNNLAIALARLARRAEAQQEFEATLRLQPNQPEAHANLGTLLLEMDRPEAAAMEFAAATRLAPQAADAWMNWGTALALLGELEAALQRYEQAARLHPGDPRPHNKAGLLLLAVGRVPDAIAQFEAALALRPDDAELQANLARARARR